MTDDAIQAALQRGAAAEAVLSNKTIQGALDEIKAGLIAQWEGASPTAPSLREQIWAQVNAINALRGSLRVDVDNAKIAAAQIERQQQKRNA